jgi:hypothetical protein
MADGTDAGFLLLPKEQAEKAGLDPKRHAYWDSPEKGLAGHPVRLEVTHQLHCLVGAFCSPSRTLKGEEVLLMTTSILIESYPTLLLFPLQLHTRI